MPRELAVKLHVMIWNISVLEIDFFIEEQMLLRSTQDNSCIEEAFTTFKTIDIYTTNKQSQHRCNPGLAGLRIPYGINRQVHTLASSFKNYQKHP